MKCLQCGWCCKNLWVMIVDDPKKGLAKNNIIEHLGNGQPCKHLRKISEFKYECLVHNCKWYKNTPCFAHTQIEKNENQPCRMGEYLLKKAKQLQ